MNLFVPKMFTKLNMNYNNGKIRLVLKKTFKLWKHFCRESFSEIILIQFSCRLKNYMPEICQNIQKVD